MYYIYQPQRSAENLFGLTTTSPQSECHETVYLHQLLKFCTLLKVVPCTQISVVAGLEKTQLYKMFTNPLEVVYIRNENVRN